MFKGNKHGLTRLLYETQIFEVWVILNLTYQGHLRSNLMLQLDSQYDFLLVSNSNHMSIFHCLAVMDTLQAKNGHLPNFPLPQGDFSQNQITSSLVQREVSASRQHWIWFVKYFWDIL